MTKYEVRLSNSSVKFLKKTDKYTRQRVHDALQVLAINPFDVSNATKIKGKEHLYRLRIGKYRLLYEVKDGVLLILVLDIGSRGDIYNRIR